MYFKYLYAAALTFCAVLPSAAQTEYLPMIEQGKVWEYHGVYYRPVENHTEGGIVTHFTKFDGTVTVNGKEYSKFKLYRSDYYRGAEVYGEVEFADSKAQDRTLGFLREEGKKVYQLTKYDYLYFDIPSEAPLDGNIENEEFGEFLVYDFSLEDGDGFYLLPYGLVTPSHILPVTVQLDTPTIVEDVPCITYSYYYESGNEDSSPTLAYRGKVIAGIGPTKDGNVSGFGPSVMPQSPNNVDSPGTGSSLVRVYSPDGQIIYGDEPNNVQVVTSEKVEDLITYDIMGRQVKETLPGSIYIRGGKKFVAK